LGNNASLQPLLSGDWEPSGVSRIQGGLEGTFARDYFLRLGYQGVLQDNQINGLTGFTAGAGLRIEQFRLDYAFVPYGDLGTSHRISLGYEFPNPTPVAPKPVTVISSPVTVQAPPVTVVATPAPTPVAAGQAKTKVEVLFDLPGKGSVPSGNAQASTLVAAYEKAAQLNPNDSRAWKNLGIVYLQTGQSALGLQCLEQAFRLNPGDTALKQWLEDYRAKHPTSQ
ncbi:MAG TPA: tetratricopeptide repeat protein, partial [bacterium]|nr:tetratricopeptide repeat protein [bacterium]